MLAITLSSCSNKQLIKTELQTIYKIKYKTLDKDLTRDCEQIAIKDNLQNIEIQKLLIESINNNNKCTQRIRIIKKFTEPEK